MQTLEFKLLKQSVQCPDRIRAVDGTIERRPLPSIDDIVQRVLKKWRPRKSWHRPESKELKSSQKRRLMTHKGDVPYQPVKVALLGSRTNCVFVIRLVNGEAINLLLGTGVTTTILKPEAATWKKRVMPSSWTLRTAIGVPAKISEATIADLLIGSTAFQLRVLVARYRERCNSRNGHYNQVWFQIGLGKWRDQDGK